MSRLLGYARVSTLEQDLAMQIDALKDAVRDGEIYIDHASSTLDQRPKLDELLRDLRRGDTLVVWRLDRLGHSVHHLICTVTELGQRGVAFRSLCESIDTHTSAGQLLFHIMASLAEVERALGRERTLAGSSPARAPRRRGGRRSVMTRDKLRAAREMYDSQLYTVQTIATTLGVSRSTIYRHLEPAPERLET